MFSTWCPVPEIACLSPQVRWLFFKTRATSISESIREERATRKNSQLAAARRVALKMGRRLRCSSVTYRLRYAPSSRLAGGPFLNQPHHHYMRDGALHSLRLVGACQDTHLRNFCSLKDVHNVDEFLDWQFFVRTDDHSRIRLLSMQADQTRFQRSRVNDFVVQSQNVVLIDRDRLNLRSID